MQKQTSAIFKILSWECQSTHQGKSSSVRIFMLIVPTILVLSASKWNVCSTICIKSELSYAFFSKSVKWSCLFLRMNPSTQDYTHCTVLSYNLSQLLQLYINTHKTLKDVF